MPDLVKYEVSDRIARVMMNRPERRNALNGALVSALSAALDRAERDPDVRVVVLTGEGNTFSAGADLAELERMQGADALQNAEDSRRLAELFRTVYLMKTPVIARVNGHAIAGGCGLAAVCDVSFAVDNARLGFTEVRIGFVPAIVMVFVLRKLGEAAARRLLLTGDLVGSSEAAQMGLITAAVSPGRLDEEVNEMARRMAWETSGSAVGLTKQMIARIPGMGLDEALDYAVQMNAFARATDDCRAGIRAFLEKAEPPWRSGASQGRRGT